MVAQTGVHVVSKETIKSQIEANQMVDQWLDSKKSMKGNMDSGDYLS